MPMSRVQFTAFKAFEANLLEPRLLYVNIKFFACEHEINETAMCNRHQTIRIKKKVAHIGDL